MGAKPNRRAHVWLESLGEWSWPGAGAAGAAGAAVAAEVAPPAWVPAFPPPPQPASGPALEPWQSQRVYRRRRLLAALTSGLAALCVALVLRGPVSLERLVGVQVAHRSPAASAAGAPESAGTPLASLPALVELKEDAAGSAIDVAHFPSSDLNGQGAFLAYLPPGYASSTQRYPVLYLLHGRQGHASAFVEIGIQQTLDRLIARRAIPPLIAVMVQDRSTLNNWRDLGRHRSASYVVEVQELVDRMLPTIPTRAARAIAGNSMGGFGAMHVALANPTRFGTVESWLGFFNNLEGELRRDKPIIAREGLHAFLYGAEEDPVAEPNQDPVFAQRLREAGAEAHSAVYPGGHSLEKIGEHLEAMILFAGHRLATR